MNNSSKVSTVLLQGNQRKPPFHFHLTDSTPLHVHVDRPSKPPGTFRSLSQDKNSRIYNVINRQKQQQQQQQQQQQVQKENQVKNNLQSNKNNSEIEKPLDSRMHLLNEKQKNLSAYEQKLRDIEDKNKQLFNNIESVCSALEAKNDARDPGKLKDWAVFLKAFACRIDQYNSLLKDFGEDRPGVVTETQLQDLMHANKRISRDLLSLDDLIGFMGVELNHLIDNKEKNNYNNKNEYQVEKMAIEMENLKTILNEKEFSYSKLKTDLQKTKDDLLLSSSAVDSLRSSKAHLHRQLGYKESDLNRATSRLNTLEMMNKDNDRYAQRNKSRGGGGDDDRQNLKNAARLYKTKSQENEKRWMELKGELGGKVGEVEALRKQLNHSDAQAAAVNRENVSLQAELERLKRLADNDEGNASNGCNKNSHQTEIDHLNASLNELKIKLVENEGEGRNLKERLKDYDELLKEYKTQNTKLKEGIDGYVRNIEGLKEDLKKKTDNSDEIGKISRKFELLQESANANNSSSDYKQFLEKTQQLERKLQKVEDENKELLRVNDKRESSLNLKNAKLEEKIREAMVFQGQLDLLNSEMKKFKEADEEKAYSMERSKQLQKMELEGQLEEVRQEFKKMKKDKEESERRNGQRQGDLRDRLEQCNSTNRTLQNYIHFLKTSYSAAFNETPVHTLTSHDNYSAHHSLGTFLS